MKLLTVITLWAPLCAYTYKESKSESIEMNVYKSGQVKTTHKKKIENKDSSYSEIRIITTKKK